MAEAQRARTVWICRHGERIDQVDPSWRRRNGHDPHLSATGVRQAIATGERLRGEGIRRIYASPFVRTVETAQHIAHVLDLPVWIEQGAMEWLNPRWFADMPALHSPRELSRRYSRVDPEYASAVIPRHPESGEQSFARAGRTARRLVAQGRGDLLLVGHGHSVVGMSWGLLGDRPPIHAHMCALIKIVRCDGAWRLALNGDRSHLE
jgi:broad specificity phosphatase PhoE